MENEKRYPLLAEQEMLRGMMGDRDGCTNCLAMIKIHGAVDLSKFEKAVQAVIDQNPALRLVFEINEQGQVVQYLGGEYTYTLDLSRPTGNSEEEKKASLLRQVHEMLDSHQRFDGSFLFNFTLFELTREEFLFVSCVNHIISDGTSNKIIIDKIIDYYNGGRAVGSGATYLDYLEENLEFRASRLMKQQQAYWRREAEGYQAFPRFPEGERQKYPARILQTIDREPIDTISRKNAISTAAVNLFLCHAAFSAAMDHPDLAIRVAEQNRSRRYRYTVGTFATTLFHRITFTRDTSLHDALIGSFDKLNENFDNAKASVNNPASPFIFSYENFIGDYDRDRYLGNATVEPFMGTMESKLWNIFSMLVFERKEHIVYKVGYDEKVFNEDIINRFLAYFELGIRVLAGEDMSYGAFFDMMR